MLGQACIGAKRPHLVPGFYYDGRSNTGWLASQEDPHLIVIDFGVRDVFAAHKSLATLHASRTEAGPVDLYMRYPVECFEGFRMPDPPAPLCLWWDDYVGCYDSDSAGL